MRVQQQRKGDRQRAAQEEGELKKHKIKKSCVKNDKTRESGGRIGVRVVGKIPFSGKTERTEKKNRGRASSLLGGKSIPAAALGCQRGR